MAVQKPTSLAHRRRLRPWRVDWWVSIRIAFGVIWLIDGALEWQPADFYNFLQTITAGGPGPPAPPAPPVNPGQAGGAAKTPPPPRVAAPYPSTGPPIPRGSRFFSFQPPVSRRVSISRGARPVRRSHRTPEWRGRRRGRRPWVT